VSALLRPLWTRYLDWRIARYDRAIVRAVWDCQTGGDARLAARRVLALMRQRAVVVRARGRA